MHLPSQMPSSYCNGHKLVMLCCILQHCLLCLVASRHCHLLVASFCCVALRHLHVHIASAVISLQWPLSLHPHLICRCLVAMVALRRMPPSSLMPSFLLLSLPSLLPATLIAVPIALSTIALFIAAIIICRTLSLFVVAHHCGHVVASSMLSCQPPPTFVDPVAG